MKKLLSLLLVSVIVLTACGRPESNSSTGKGDGNEVHTIRIAYLVSEEQSSHLAAETFKVKLEKDSNGRLKVELYPNGQL